MRYCGIGKSGFAAAVSSAKGKARWWEYNIREPFIKMLPTDIAAGIGLAQLDRIGELQNVRKQVWNRYQRELSELAWITNPVDASEPDVHSYFTYCIRVPRRDDLAHFLLDNGVYTTLRYHPLHLNPLYRQMETRLPNCEALNDDCLSIPLHPRLSSDDVDKVVELIREFGKRESL
jgi:aminotransferase